MRTNWRRVLGLCLSLGLIAVPLLSVRAEAEEPQARTLSIASETEFLAFAEQCRLDAYSQGLTVSLDADLDLQGASFSGVPIFLGTLEGNGHTISGVAVSQDGSVQGLFRYLGETGVLRNLTVQGTVAPAGSQADVGGLVGINGGKLEQCRFEGEVAGGDRVGGIVGTNQVAGILDGCQVSGNVHGAHAVGGLVGENYGVIRSGISDAAVNDTAQENEVNLSAVTIDTVTGTEAANTVTDVGGIAGGNLGVIRDCRNNGTVGYRHMGYNIGGIAGSQMGYIEQCSNSGAVYGRKEVGGIVGQMEPVAKVEYRADTLQILQRQLNDTTALAAQVSGRAQNGAESMAQQVDALRDHTTAAKDAVDQLVPDRENPQLPDPDTVTAAKNVLSGSITGAQNSMEQIADTSRSTALTMARDVNVLANQMNQVSSTLYHASDHLGGTVTDRSDADTAEDQTGKVFRCTNYGPVQGDLNAGGIAGAMAWENDLDPEEDLSFTGEQSLNFDSELRVVIRDCRNEGAVTIKKRQAGGIVGYMALGLTKECVNLGVMDGADGTLVGGIAGRSAGFLRDNYVKCRLLGRASVGGIAGSGTIVSGCRSLVEMEQGVEKLGAVLGVREESRTSEEPPLKGNCYMVRGTDLGGVDGVSYAGQAEPMPEAAFLEQEDLPEGFCVSTITFVSEDETVETVELPLGAVLTEEQVPAVPEREGHTGWWDGLDALTSGGVYFDQTVMAVYDGYEQTIRSQAERENGKPVLLAEGTFVEQGAFVLEELEEQPEVSGGRTVLEGWVLPTFAEAAPTKLRLACPEEESMDAMEIQVRGEDGGWRKVETKANGSYLVFSVEPTDTGFCLIRHPQMPGWVWLSGVGAGVVLLLVGGVLCSQKAKKNQKTECAGVDT